MASTSFLMARLGMGCAVRYDDAFQKEVREQWFPNHIAKFTEHPDGTKILEWRNKSGTSVYWFTAVLRNGALCIFGDIGEAIYRWYPDVHSWEFFADTGIGYSGAAQSSARTPTRDSSRAQPTMLSGSRVTWSSCAAVTWC